MHSGQSGEAKPRLAGGEPDSLGRRDLNRRAGLRIAPLALAALGDQGAEAGDAGLLALLQRLGDGADHRLHGLGQVGALRKTAIRSVWFISVDLREAAANIG